MRFEWLSGEGAGAPELLHQESSSGDTIALVFTGVELTEFVTDPGLHGELADWVAWVPAGGAPKLSADASPEIAPLDAADYQALVIHGAPPSIDVTPANDEGGQAWGEFVIGTAEGTFPIYPDGGVPLTLDSDGDTLLQSLGDHGLPGVEAVDALESLAGLVPETGAQANTFLLTNLDIADLIADYDQVPLPGLSGGEGALLHDDLATGPLNHPVPTIIVEIDDGSAAANTHILT